MQRLSQSEEFHSKHQNSDFTEIKMHVENVCQNLKSELETQHKSTRNNFDNEIRSVLKDIEYLKKSNDYF